jgi:hypothetical protein
MFSRMQAGMFTAPAPRVMRRGQPSVARPLPIARACPLLWAGVKDVCFALNAAGCDRADVDDD